MEIENDSVLLKLLYYCASKREVYFKRSDVTEFIVNESEFTIPNKQGFDGNLSYFGYDIKNDVDNNRILLLRGNTIGKACLNGGIDFRIGQDVCAISVSEKEDIFHVEFEKLTQNKTKEASVFRKIKSHAEQMQLQVCNFRIYGNKRIFYKSGEYFIYPRILFEPTRNVVEYEVVNSSHLSVYKPNVVFPKFNRDFEIDGETIIAHNRFEQDGSLGEFGADFVYFDLRNGIITEIDIQEEYNTEIIELITRISYNLSDKETTRKAVSNLRINTGTLRKLVLARDGGKCRLCDINDESLLVCSHIKPWRTGEARLDMNNAITLCRMHDALFDQGYISFDESGNMLLANNGIFGSNTIKRFLESSISRLDINRDMKSYLEYHRENVFMH